MLKLKIQYFGHPLLRQAPRGGAAEIEAPRPPREGQRPTFAASPPAAPAPPTPRRPFPQPSDLRTRRAFTLSAHARGTAGWDGVEIGRAHV